MQQKELPNKDESEESRTTYRRRGADVLVAEEGCAADEQ